MDESGEPKKLCAKCGKVKPLSEFCKNATKKDGRESACKGCANSSRNLRRTSEAVKTITDNADAIKSKTAASSVIAWNHIGSIVRQIGEIENQISAERTERNRRILRAKDESDQAIRSLNKQQLKLYEMLEEFARKRYGGTTLVVKKVEFGLVRIVGDEVEVSPFLDKIAASEKE